MMPLDRFPDVCRAPEDQRNALATSLIAPFVRDAEELVFGPAVAQYRSVVRGAELPVVPQVSKRVASTETWSVPSPKGMTERSRTTSERANLATIPRKKHDIDDALAQMTRGRMGAFREERRAAGEDWIEGR
jgi:hypothetical protein